jgi:hypothetical protein
LHRRLVCVRFDDPVTLTTQLSICAGAAKVRLKGLRIAVFAEKLRGRGRPGRFAKISFGTV